MKNISVIKILLADDHPIILEGVRTLFEDEEAFSIVGEALSIKQTISLIGQTRPHIILMDLNMKGENSLDFIGDILSRFPQVKVIMFSSYDSPKLVRLAIEKGVHGYLLKNIQKADLLGKLQNIINGKKEFPQFSSAQKTPLEKEKVLEDRFLKKEMLSDREIEIVKFIAMGNTEQEIADKLFLSKHTVHTHRKNIMSKLDLHSAVDLVRFAIKNRIID